MVPENDRGHELGRADGVDLEPTPSWGSGLTGWEAESLTAIHRVAATRHNTRIVDFRTAAIGHPEHVADDGVHLTHTGAEALDALLLTAAAR